MNAFDIVLRRRNAQNNGYEEVLVPVAKLQNLGFNALKEPVAGRTAIGATAANITTAGAGTYTAANLLTGLITRDPNGAGRTDTTATAEEIIAAFAAVNLLTNDYDEAFFILKNTADANETITLAGGTGVTLKGALTVGQNMTSKFALMRISSTAIVLREV